MPTGTTLQIIASKCYRLKANPKDLYLYVSLKKGGREAEGCFSAKPKLRACKWGNTRQVALLFIFQHFSRKEEFQAVFEFTKRTETHLGLVIPVLRKPCNSHRAICICQDVPIPVIQSLHCLYLQEGLHLWGPNSTSNKGWCADTKGSTSTWQPARLHGHISPQVCTTNPYSISPGHVTEAAVLAKPMSKRAVTPAKGQYCQCHVLRESWDNKPTISTFTQGESSWCACGMLTRPKHLVHCLMRY